MAEGTAPIVAKIVIDDSGISGGPTRLPSGSESGTKKTNKILKELLRTSKMGVSSNIFGIGGTLTSLLSAIGGLTPGIVGGVTAGVGGLVGGAAALGEGLINQQGITSEEDAAAVADAMDSTVDEINDFNMAINKGQGTISKTPPKIEDLNNQIVTAENMVDIFGNKMGFSNALQDAINKALVRIKAKLEAQAGQAETIRRTTMLAPPDQTPINPNITVGSITGLDGGGDHVTQASFFDLGG